MICDGLKRSGSGLVEKEPSNGANNCHWRFESVIYGITVRGGGQVFPKKHNSRVLGGF